MVVHLTIVIISWLVSIAAAVGALSLSFRESKAHRLLAFALSMVTLFIGYLGYGHWSPFRFFPQVGWMWSEGSFQIHLASSWFFLVPLLLGAAAVILLLSRALSVERFNAKA